MNIFEAGVTGCSSIVITKLWVGFPNCELQQSRITKCQEWMKR
jgi:hypothetical protein